MECQKLNVIPYLEVDGVRTFRDSDIVSWWNRMFREGSGQHVFRDGSIKTAEDFLWQMKRNPDCQLYVCLLERDPVLLAWLNRFQYHYCQAHFCGFQRYWGTPTIRQAGRLMLKTFFLTQDIHMILGLTPADNAHAQRYLEEIGVRRVGVLPQGYWNAHHNRPEDAIIYQALRGDYESL